MNMKKLRIETCLLAAVLATSAGCSRVASTPDGGDGWSQATNGLQARLRLVEKDKLYGTRWLVPYLELRNVRDLGHPMEVNCDNPHLKVELVSADGEQLLRRRSLNRSGPVRELSTVILPWDSAVRISLECRNWGIPKDAAAMVSADSGAWVIQEHERGKVFLRATLVGERTEPSYRTWDGRIQTPLLKVDWK